MLPILVAVLMVVNVVVLTKFSDTSQKLAEQQSMTMEIKTKKNIEIQSLSRDKLEAQTSLKEERLKSAKEIQSLKEKLQAKKAAQAKLASATVQRQVNVPAPNISGNKASWLAASGIPESQWGLVDWIVSRESGWNPCAYYPGQSDCNANPVNACGLVQQNPCHKIPGDWRDPVAALKWQYNYVCTTAKFRPYGPCYQGAVGYWKVHGNY